ncbi:very short patch repair endonuclease [Hymenobacter siberiensis]|uniref:very short patch repair endonuclease n=1 Tax=Hymenobacter siberiensis TaxID=2848396 RepID=UPI001C1E0006|nr:very short patch repair endonuclease [Hymenobacter siberiensis]MBU6122278.1 very short patch repair endonuclease [Hymenobacter siberiensis]
MLDVTTTPARSYNMSQVKGKNTKPEMLVRKYLHAQGLRFRLHGKDLPGSPDIVFPSRKAVVFIQGCFWHAHGAECLVKPLKPKSNVQFWQAKFDRNVSRDARQQAELQELGWHVFVIWECYLKKQVREATLTDLRDALLSLPKS